MRTASDSGLAAAKKFARTHDSEPQHAFHVHKLCMDFFDQTADLHGLGAAERRVLSAAAMVHDTGYGVDPTKHHKGARDLILKSKIEGFTERELKMIACIARYHRKAHPAKSHEVYRDLDGEDRQRVRKLSALLRLTDGLDRAHDTATRRIRVELKGNVLRLFVHQRKPSPVDIMGAERKRQLFEEVFKMRVEIIPETQSGAAVPHGKKHTDCAQ